jgi:uncharacterized protein YggT (Ycf19 family)
MDSFHSPTTKPLYRATQVLWYIIGFIEVLLLFRFTLKLLSANGDAVFTSLIYSASHPFVSPFLSVFRVTSIDGNIFEWTTLLAMLVYSVIGSGIAQLLVMGKSVSTPEAAAKLKDQEA